MITVEYEGMYISDKEYIAILTHKNYPRHRRKVRLMLPGYQYIPTIKKIVSERGFCLTIIEER